MKGEDGKNAHLGFTKEKNIVKIRE